MKNKILHVDDSLEMLRLVSTKLNAHGYEVFSLDDPTGALDLLVEKNIRVCLLDIDMPEINGLELLEKIKKLDGGIQVIMLTGKVTQTNVLESHRLGAEACFFKPIESFEPILKSIHDTFEKLEHWWESLRVLRRRKRENFVDVS